MKNVLQKYLILVLLVFLGACSADKKNEMHNNTTFIKSDILLTNSSIQARGITTFEEHTLTVSGTSLLKAIVSLKIVNEKGEEVSCISYPVEKLIHQEYRTANSTLKEAHIRKVVKDYFDVKNELVDIN